MRCPIHQAKIKKKSFHTIQLFQQQQQFNNLVSSLLKPSTTAKLNLKQKLDDSLKAPRTKVMLIQNGTAQLH